MDLSEYLPLLNGSVRLYINKRGFITVDQIHHVNIFKFALVHYWERFSKCMEQEFMWSMLKNISSTERFEFYLNGKPHKAPAVFHHIMRKEKERMIILNLKNRRTIVPNTTVFIIAAILLCILTMNGNRKYKHDLSSLYNSLVVRPTQFLTHKTRAIHLL